MRTGNIFYINFMFCCREIFLSNEIITCSSNLKDCSNFCSPLIVLFLFPKL